MSLRTPGAGHEAAPEKAASRDPPPPPLFAGWEEERRLETAAGTALFEEFTRRYVRPEFLKKFVRDFNTGSGISPRYLNPGYTVKPYSKKVTLEELFDRAVPGHVEVEEIWHIPPGEGTWKRGRTPVMIWLFRSDEGPSLLQVRFDGNAFFLLLPHDDIEVLRSPAG